jgi:predicted DNA-binding WGR domain protein
MFREALSAFYQIYASDLRFRPRDRTAYLQYLQRQAAKDPSSAKSAAQMRQSEEFVLAGLAEQEESDILDPILTVHPDQAFLEVFSKDESSYARLSLHWDIFDQVADLTYGTTHVDFSPQFYEELQKIRSYKQTAIEMGQLQGLSIAHETTFDTAKTLRIADSWLRGFLQVQSAAALPMTHFTLSPIDLYNALIYLRRNKAKKGPRGLRYELIPNQPARLIIEPIEQIFFGQGSAYQGSRPQIVRTWGRQRLFLLQRILPFTQHIDVYTLGSGLPTFYVLRMEGASLTLGLSGWTDKNWSASSQFDALLPSQKVEEARLASLVELMRENFCMSMEQICEDLQTTYTQNISALQQLSRKGVIAYDLELKVFRYREISAETPAIEKLKYRNEHEANAHALLDAPVTDGLSEPVQITKFNHVLGSGSEIHGQIEDRAAYRQYKTNFFIDLDGRISRAKCTCAWFQRTSFKEGPCEHILALLLLYQRQQAEREELRRQGKDRQVIVAETRTLTRRHRKEETIYQLTLDHKQLRVQWGQRGTDMRRQTLLFNSPAQARDAYFDRLDQLANKGYIESHA